MRTILMAIAAAFAIGLFAPSAAHAVTGNINQAPKAGTAGEQVQLVHSRRRGHYRHYRGHRPRSGFYFYYNTAPRRYYNYYYPQPRRTYRRQDNYCSYWSRRCAANWGYGGPDYRGCMRYYNCR